jgi:hypothetical protein
VLCASACACASCLALTSVPAWATSDQKVGLSSIQHPLNQTYCFQWSTCYTCPMCKRKCYKC